MANLYSFFPDFLISSCIDAMWLESFYQEFDSGSQALQLLMFENVVRHVTFLNVPYISYLSK